MKLRSRGQPTEILYFSVKQGVAHDLKNIFKLRSRGWPTVEYVYYFPVKQGVAHEQENILMLRRRGWPTVEYFVFLFSKGWPSR